jgi:LysM repeat protein
MNNPNPFLPQVTLLDQKNKKRARVKVAVFSIFACNILLISPLLIQGCRDKQPATQSDAGTTPTNDTAGVDTNVVTPPPLTNPVVPPVAPPPVVVVPPTPPSATEYVIVKGDSFSKIAHDHGITVKALETANPGLDPAKLQIGKKLQLPAPTITASGATTATVADSADTYTVKSGDSLFKIAHDHSITIKALRAANDLKTDKIKVGQKLKLPSGTSTATPTVDAAPPVTASTSTVSTATPPPTTGSAH